MGSLSDYAELELLDHVFNAAYSPVETVYLCLCTADPTDAGTGASMNEYPDTQGYARTAIAFGAAAARRITQNADVSFPIATGEYTSPITHWAICDSGVHGAGNMLAHGQTTAYDSGNCDGIGADTSKLRDTAQNFLTTVQVGMKVYNTTDSTISTVTVVDSDTELTLADDIMDDGEDYEILGFLVTTGNVLKIASGQVYIEIQATAAGAGFTTYCVNLMLDLMFRNQAWATPAGDTHVAIYTAVLDDDDDDTTDQAEEDATEYVRTEVNPNGGASPTWDLAASGVVDNTHEITLEAEVGTDDWDTDVALAIVTTASGAGKILCYDSANVTDQRPRTGDSIKVAAGAFDVTLS